MAKSEQRAPADELGSPLAVASLRGASGPDLAIVSSGSVPGPLLERELKRATGGVSPVARDLLEILAAIAHGGTHDWDEITKPEQSIDTARWRTTPSPRPPEPE